jgi:hypothetical protein
VRLREEVVNEFLTATVLREDIAAEATNAPLQCGRRQSFQEDFPDTVTLHLIDHRDGRLCNGRIIGEPEETGH